MSSTKEWTNIFNIPVIMVRFSIPNSKKKQNTFAIRKWLAFSTVFRKFFLLFFRETKLNPVKRSENDKNEIRIKFNTPAIMVNSIPNSKKLKYLWYPQMTFKQLENLLFQRLFGNFSFCSFTKNWVPTVFSRFSSFFFLFAY